MREMRIARQSLYDTFGDKRALYLKAGDGQTQLTALACASSIAETVVCGHAGRQGRLLSFCDVSA